MLSKPIVLAPHGVFSQRWRYSTLKKRLYLTLLGRRILQRCSCLHATAPPEVEAFRNVGYRGPVALVPNGVNPEEFENLPDTGEADEVWPLLRGRRVVCFMGRIHKVKGLDQLIPAWKQVRRFRDEVLLVIAGPADGGHRAAIADLVAKAGIQDSVLFTGMVTGSVKLTLLSRSDMVVLPSYCESFGLVVAEALACGTPVVATVGTPWKELLEVGAGYWVEPRTDDLAEAIGRILDMHEVDRQAMGERGRKLILERYTWDIAARKMITVYNCMLEGRKIPLFPEPVPLEPTANNAIRD